MSKKISKKEKDTEPTKTPGTNKNAGDYLHRRPVWKFRRLDCDHQKWSMKQCGPVLEPQRLQSEAKLL